MALTGRATIYGIDGTIAYAGAATYLKPRRLTLRGTATVEENLNGAGKLRTFLFQGTSIGS